MFKFLAIFEYEKEEKEVIVVSSSRMAALSDLREMGHNMGRIASLIQF